MKIVTGRVRARPDSLDDLLAVSLEHVRRSREEPGCLHHSVHQSAEDPLDLFFYEEWQDDDVLSRHFAVPASLAFVTRLSELAAGPPSMEIHEVEHPG